MKIIFLKDVPRAGKKWDVKNVSDGYARNLLIPKGLAQEATESRVRDLLIRQKELAEMKEVDLNILHKNLEALSGKTVTIVVQANEKGHLFKGIHQKEIAETLKKELRVDIVPNMIKLDEPVKSVGKQTVVVEAGKGKVSFELLIEAK